MTNIRHNLLRILSTALLTAVLAMAVAAPDALADRRGGKHGRSDSDAREPSHRRERHWSLDSAVSRIRERTDGRVLSAETKRKNGRDVYRIKILTPDGRVRQFRVDPRTGKVER